MLRGSKAGCGTLRGYVLALQNRIVPLRAPAI